MSDRPATNFARRDSKRDQSHPQVEVLENRLAPNHFVDLSTIGLWGGPADGIDSLAVVQHTFARSSPVRLAQVNSASAGGYGRLVVDGSLSGAEAASSTRDFVQPASEMAYASAPASEAVTDSILAGDWLHSGGGNGSGGRSDPGATGNPGILPVNSDAFGRSYGQWSAASNQWSFSLPVDHHPLFDTADCSQGQSGNVWFLGGTFTEIQVSPNVVDGTADRQCNLPQDKAIFFPIVSAEASTIEGNGTTEAQLRAAANDMANHIVNLSATVDGQALHNLADYRVQSPLYTFGPLPANNILQASGVNAPAGSTSHSVSDGYFLLHTPFSSGTHTLHYSGSAVFTVQRDGFDFTFNQDITYHLHV